MADIGEQEIIEDDVPLMQLTSKKIKRDNQAFGKYPGGMGHEMAAAHQGSALWGFATVSHGSKFLLGPRRDGRLRVLHLPAGQKSRASTSSTTWTRTPTSGRSTSRH